MARNRLFVGNLPSKASEKDVEEHFKAIGPCTVSIPRDGDRSRGFCFVEFGTGAEAQGAIEKLDGTNLMGREIIVNLAREREERRPAGNRRGQGFKKGWD